MGPGGRREEGGEEGQVTVSSILVVFECAENLCGVLCDRLKTVANTSAGDTAGGLALFQQAEGLRWRWHSRQRQVV